MRNRIATRKTAYRVVQVPIALPLLEEIDAAADRVAETRAAYIRGACEHRLKAEQVEALDRRYVEGYRRRPEGPTWARVGARLLARRLRRDAW
jgi:hypothetical protein